ncbi:cytochrome C oxidase subunit IV family protein [Nevskia ramosa]|uniref:cytochrome C oxidase subunit IV family protein n=1 Tax=Nevskia ramosa TaxID=64002 RepID=UPI003D0EB164
MKALLLSRVTAVWALLIIATTLSWQLGHGVGFDDARQAGAAILVVTFIKVRMVMRDFMEIRHAPRWMRLASDGWIVLITVLLVGLFLKTGT